MDSRAPNPYQNRLDLADTWSNYQQRSPISLFTQEEVLVLRSLKYEDDRDIFAWLKLARSHPMLGRLTDFEYSSALPRLTKDQVRAILLLKDLNADRVSGLLRQVRGLGAIQTSAASASYHIYDQAPNQVLEGSSILSDTSLPRSSVTSPHGGTHQQNLTQGPAAKPSPAPTASLAQKGYKYYCTYCDSVESFELRDEWYRHERDHSLDYVCMLNGATEATTQGMKCAFCGKLDPSEGHLSTHNIQICRPESSGPFSCKRNKDMLEHVYKAHHAKMNFELIQKWKTFDLEQAWSCGFCVFTFTNFDERKRHIASHFEQGRTIDEWDATKVIQGLLERPGMKKAWEVTLASRSTSNIDDRYWEKRTTKALRRDLEVGPTAEKTAVDLAEAAFAASKVKIRRFNTP